MEQEKQFLTVPEFADAAGISKQAVYQAINSGKLKGYTQKIGRQMKIDAVALVEVYGRSAESRESRDSSNLNQESKENQADSSGNSQDSKENQAESSKDSQESKEESSNLNQESKEDSSRKSSETASEGNGKTPQNQSELVKSLQEEVKFLREELRSRRAETAELRKIIGMQQLQLAAPAKRPADSDQGAAQEQEEDRTAEAPGADPEGPEAERTAEGMPDKEEKAADPDELERLQAELEAERTKRIEAEEKLTAEQQKGFFQWLRDKFRG